MRKIYVCSPLRGNVQKNIVMANLYSRFVYEKGYMPIAPHCIYTQFLDDKSKKERKDGMRMGLELMWVVQELWVFGYNITEGMQKEIELAKQLKIKIKYFDSEMYELKKGGGV